MAFSAGKKSYTIVCQVKISYHQWFGQKILTQTKSPIPPLKSQLVGSLDYSLQSLHFMSSDITSLLILTSFIERC